MVFSDMLRKIIAFIKTQGLFGLAIFLVIGLPLLWFWPQRGLVGKYFDNHEWKGEPAFTRLDKQINLEVVNQKQETFPQRYISITWKGWIRIDREGEYTFSTESDDGSSIFIDNSMVVDNGGIHVTQKVSEKIFLTKGLHSLSINYFQERGAYTLRVFWKEPGKAEIDLSPHYLYPRPFPIRGIGFLSRNLGTLYPLSWLFLLLIVVGRRVKRERHNLTGVIKEYAQNISLMMIAILVFGLAAEGITRLVLYIREDRRDVKLLLKESKEADFEGGPRIYSLKGIVQESSFENIVYELKPNLKGTFRDVPLITNSRGLRDLEYSYRKPENTFRIVGLGDSSLFGWGVRMEDTSLKVLERKLNQQSSSMNYEVINFAAPGYNTTIEVEVFLKKCLKYEPDLVIMHFNTNDYDVPGFMKPPQRYSSFKKSYFLNFLYSRFQPLWGSQRQEVIPFMVDRTMGLEESDRLDEDPNFPDEYRHMVGKKGFLRALDKLVKETTSQGIPLVIYVVKPYPGLDPLYTPNAFRDDQLKLITQLSQEKGFFLLNMYAAYVNYFKEHPNEENRVMWVSRGDSHPSAVAHNVEAEALYNFLIENNLVGNSK